MTERLNWTEIRGISLSGYIVIYLLFHCWSIFESFSVFFSITNSASMNNVFISWCACLRDKLGDYIEVEWQNSWVYAPLIHNDIISRMVVKIYNLFSRFKFSFHSVIIWYGQIIENFFLICRIYRNVRLYLFLDLHFPNTNHIEKIFPWSSSFVNSLSGLFQFFSLWVYIFYLLVFC